MAILIFLMGVLCIRYFNVCKVQRDTGFIPNAGIVVFKKKKKKCLDCTYKVKIFFLNCLQ